MSVYTDWGFSDNPFQETRLLPDPQGATLLVGRDTEVNLLLKRLLNPPKLPILDGANGIGKTSLINVTVFKEFARFLENPQFPLFIPCRKIFQLEEGRDVAEFTDEVFMEVAQTLLEHSQLIKQHCVGELGRASSIDNWLNSPQFTNWQAGVPILSAGGGSQPNESTGFEKSGFRRTIQDWLSSIFPNPSAGGVVCVIDNLELLQTSETAKNLLEQLRDPLLTITGIRCVLCGANGITWTLASSMRLEGHLHEPQTIAGIDSALAPEILESRRRAFAVDDEDPYLPIDPLDFESLYEVLNKNLRSLLHHTDEFCMWASDKRLPKTPEEKRFVFNVWLSDACARYYDAANTIVTNTAWLVFDKAIEIGGSFSPGEYSKFGYQSGPALRQHVKTLVSVNLLHTLREDEQDKRLKSISITPRGRLVAYHRKRQGEVTYRKVNPI